MGMVDAAVVLEELGRALCPAPYASSAIGAVSLVLAAGAPREHAFLLPGLADGSTIGTLALYEPGTPLPLARRRDRGRASTATAWRLDGTKVHVADGAAADLFLVTARDADGALGVFAVQGDDDGVRRRADADRRRQPQGGDGRASTARRAGGSAPATRPTRSRARSTGSAVAYVVDGVGAAAARARARGRVREGARAVRQADRLVPGRAAPVRRHAARVELGRAAGYYACWAADDADPAEAHRAAVMAKAFASDAYAQLGGTAIQVFGGIGFTWEHDIHLYYKRLLSLSVVARQRLRPPRRARQHRHRLTRSASFGDVTRRRTVGGYSRTRSRQPQVLPPPAPMTPTSGGVAIWRSPASPHICVAPSCRKP